MQPLQPLVVDGGSGGATARRSLFQRRSHGQRGGHGSPISPKQQFEVIAASEAGHVELSPTLRKCCMDCPAGGDLVIVQSQEGMAAAARERRSSRGDTNSDSSSKDGSIQGGSSADIFSLTGILHSLFEQFLDEVIKKFF